MMSINTEFIFIAIFIAYYCIIISVITFNTLYIILTVLNYKEQFFHWLLMMNVNAQFIFFTLIIAYNSAIMSEITLYTLHYSNCMKLRTILPLWLLMINVIAQFILFFIVEIDCNYKCFYHEIPLCNYIYNHFQNIIILF